MLLCENHTAPVLNIWFMNDVSDKFITCSEDGTIRLWDGNNYTVTARCVAPAAPSANLYPTCACFTDEVILSGWSDGKIRAFRIDNC
jgi:WD40 repeat protein